MQLARRDALPASKDYDWWVQAVFWLGARHVAGMPLNKYQQPVVAAREIYLTGGPVAWEIEARTLARENTRVIADKCSLPAETVLAYKRLFFGVELRLDQPHYINTTIIGTHKPWLPTDVRKVWLYYGYTGGWKVLDYVVDHYRRVGQPDYSYLLARSPETRQRDIWDLKWETTLRLRFAELTPRQAIVLADLATRHVACEPASPRMSPAIARAAWLDQQLGALFVAETKARTAASPDRSVA